MKYILVACGSGIMTPIVVVIKIRGKCEDNGVLVSVTRCKFPEVKSKADDLDSLVTTGEFTGGNVNIPVVDTISLLTEINEDAMLDEILFHLK